MNADVVLALITDLYAQAVQAQKRVAELEARLADLEPPPTPAGP